MRYKLIMLEQPIIIDEKSDIKSGDFYYSGGGVYKMSPEMSPYQFVGYKIIAGIPGLPIIDFSEISEQDLKKIDYIDVEKLALDFEKKWGNTYNGEIDFFIEGFKQAKSIYHQPEINFSINRKYFFQLIDKVIEKERKLNFSEFNDWFNSDFLRMLPPITKKFQVELEEKIVNNSIKILKIENN